MGKIIQLKERYALNFNWEHRGRIFRHGTGKVRENKGFLKLIHLKGS